MSVVTCRTAGCPSEGQPVEMNLTYEIDGQTETVDHVVCGACGQQITDIADQAAADPD